jgi:hypothetical protein
MLNALTVQAHEGGANHWLVGGITLAILLVMLLALLIFGAGREHS